MRYPAKETAEKHKRILQEASQMFRERGFQNVTVAEVMKAAELTHGAFYNHFESKDALMTAATEYAMEAARAGLQRASGTAKSRAAYFGRYLSTEHRDNLSTGCPIAALSGEIRHEPAVKEVFTAKLKEIVEEMSGDRAKALLKLSAMVGALAIARAVSDSAFSLEVLQQVKKELDRKAA
jgi:TetR/AcrR family transcriptional regulator, transcriptional repressor for nem operon